MNYLRIPGEISLSDIKMKDVSFSPGMYRRVIIPTSTVKRVRDLLNYKRPFDKGIEPGSMWYMNRSTHHLIRTKALQDHSYLLYPKGDAIIPINPKVFDDPVLCDGDILMSKDSNIGECAIIDSNHWRNHMFSSGVVRLHPSSDRYYFFSFLKHPLFKIQLLTMAPRAAIITHAKTLWLDCLIPFPNQKDADRVIRYVSALTQAIIEKEKAIRERHQAIFSAIDSELTDDHNDSTFLYSHPNILEIRALLRMDTGLYCLGFKKFKHRIDNYKFGSICLSEMGVKSRRGPNLAVSVIGRSLYSEKPKQGWYQLIRPTNISEYGTLTKKEWLGTNKKLPVVNVGDLILGCEGFEKGRSTVLVEGMEQCTTNFHGTILYWPGAELWQTVFVRCFLAYLREHGVVDWVGVGGSGGHMSPEYFDYLPFPKFSDTKQAEIARFYHNPSPPPKELVTLDTFVDWHRRWNDDIGIWELDLEMKVLQRTLSDVQEQIIEGKTVKVPI
jgi:type I restriction enzyme S subunit